jgi:hypothetical protein
MDPNANLEQQLRAAREILRSQAEDGGGYDDGVIDLAEAVVALDEWITKGGFLPAQWTAGPADPEQLTVALRGWGEQHTFLDSEAEDSFDRGIGNIFWALAVENGIRKAKGEKEAEQ